MKIYEVLIIFFNLDIIIHEKCTADIKPQAYLCPCLSICKLHEKLRVSVRVE